MRLPLCATLLLATALPATALPATALPAQTILLPPGATYPLAKSTVVNPDHTITFRLADPNAKQVLLRYDMSADPVPMRRDTTGLWSFTSAPLPPEIYAYTLTVDGEPRLDPSNRRINEVATGAISQSIEIPGPLPQPWDLTDIPHGDLTQRRFTTRIGQNFPNNQSSYLVYTPPGFDPRAQTKYPVLYLLNGYSQLETGWRDLHANLILDNLIAQGKAVPMIVVMPLAYGDLSFLTKGGEVWQDRTAVSANVRLFAQILTREIIPQIEAAYPVSTGRKDRALAGLSMGGLEALTIGLNDTAQFASVAGFSAAIPGTGYDAIFPTLNATSANLSLLWVACGTEDNLITPNRAFATWLKQKNLPVTPIETSGRHVGYVWRDNLVNFAPLLFRPIAKPSL